MTNYKLHHGDALAIMAEMEAESIDCIWTDPPHRLSNGGTTDHLWNRKWIQACYRLLKRNGTIWVTGTFHSYPSVGYAMQQLGYWILNDIVWQKPSPPPNLGHRTFIHSTEIILWASKGKGEKHRFNYETMKKYNGGKPMKNVWTMSAPRSTSLEKEHGSHPTQKPVMLVERCLLASTFLGNVVFDPFMGSGTTGVAALEAGCDFIGIDAEEEYVELAERRLSAINGTC